MCIVHKVHTIYVTYFRASYIIQRYDEMVCLKNYLFLQYHLIDNQLHRDLVEKNDKNSVQMIPQRKIQKRTCTTENMKCCQMTEEIFFSIQNLLLDIFKRPVFYAKHGSLYSLL